MIKKVQLFIPFKETLKRFKNKSIDIVKLDCEGSNGKF